MIVQIILVYVSSIIILFVPRYREQLMQLKQEYEFTDLTHEADLKCDMNAETSPIQLLHDIHLQQKDLDAIESFRGLIVGMGAMIAILV